MPELNFFDWKQETSVSSLRLNDRARDELVRLALTYTHPYQEDARVRLVLSDIDPTFDTSYKLAIRKYFRERTKVCEVMIAFEKHLENLKKENSTVCPLQKVNIPRLGAFALTSHIPYDEIIKFAKILIKNGCNEVFWVHVAKQNPEKKCCGVCSNIKPQLVKVAP